MRRPRHPLSPILVLLVPLACGTGACSGRALRDSPAQPGTAAHAPDRRPAAAPAPAGAPSTGAAAAASEGIAPPGRAPLGTPQALPLPFTIEPSLDRRSVLFLSKTSSDRAGWVRQLDGATGEMGPPLLLLDEDLAGALSSADGKTTLLTSRDGELCVTTFLPGEITPASRACAPARAHAMAAVGDRVALIELVQRAPAEDARKPRAPRERKAAAGKPARKGPAAAKPGKATAATRPDKATATKRPDKATAAQRPDTDKAPGASGSPSKKKRRDGRAREDRPKKKGAAPRPRRPDPPPEVEVRLRWLSPHDGIAPASSPTGLRFRPPLDGMGLIDAGGRPGAIDLLYYAASPRRRSPSWLGSAHIAFASLNEDGKLAPGRSAVVVEGDLEYGFIRGHQEPRLVTTSAGAAYIGVTGRNGACEATRLAPSFQPSLAGLVPRAICAVDPARFASPDPLTPAEIGGIERIAATGARRAAGQPAYDPGLAVWAGDRAYYQVAGELFSASRGGGPPRGEPAPFLAQRARIAWGALAPDGEGLAYAAGQLYRLDGRGQVTAAAAPEGLARAPAGGAPGTPIGEPEYAADRRRVARIGASWWIARTDVVRLLPEPLVVPALRGRAHEGGATLVGGRERGLFLEVLGDRLHITGLAPSGALAPLPVAPGAAGAPTTPVEPPTLAVATPVRPGFDACERGGGGALVAGVSAADPGKVVAFPIDAHGRPGPARETSLPLARGGVAVRLVALPQGGALLSDAARSHVVWLDDDGAELASRPWPADDTGALCADGRPARRVIPAPAPGVFVTVPELAAPGACVVGDVAWAGDGSVRWFGSAASGLDAQAEAGIARPALPEGATPAVRPAATASAAGEPAATLPSTLPAAPPAALAPALSGPATAALAPALSGPATAALAPTLSGPPACPSDMVAIEGGRFCVDRFEAMLVDAITGQALSPDYPSTPNLLELSLAEWSTGRQRTGNLHARAFPLPLLPGWQRGRTTGAVARSRAGARPSGYVTGLVAESACAAAGKRLCTLDELVTACRGEDDTLYPYGDAYEERACNVFRDGHPAAMLHDNASIGHLDPRLNRVRVHGEPLLQETGSSPRCASRWGADAVYDLVGNLDEWVDEPGGAFAGGFYARSTRAGCEAVITSHPKSYLDYSTGVRCCRDGLSTAARAAPSPRSPEGAPAPPTGDL